MGYAAWMAFFYSLHKWPQALSHWGVSADIIGSGHAPKWGFAAVLRGHHRDPDFNCTLHFPRSEYLTECGWFNEDSCSNFITQSSAKVNRRIGITVKCITIQTENVVINLTLVCMW